MPIHFAPSRRPARAALARHLFRPAELFARNDNGADEVTTAQVDTPLLRAALEHFATHGLAAAQQAYDAAQAAGQAGDTTGSHHWRAVCRMLDKRLPARRSR